MKYYLITFEQTVGEFSFMGRVVKMAADDVSTEDIINDYFGEFYGDTTTKQGNVWWDEEKCPQRVVKLPRAQEISKEDYEVLIKYLPV